MARLACISVDDRMNPASTGSVVVIAVAAGERDETRDTEDNGDTGDTGMSRRRDWYDGPASVRLGEASRGLLKEGVALGIGGACDTASAASRSLSLLSWGTTTAGTFDQGAVGDRAGVSGSCVFSSSLIMSSRSSSRRPTSPLEYKFILQMRMTDSTMLMIYERLCGCC